MSGNPPTTPPADPPTPPANQPPDDKALRASFSTFMKDFLNSDEGKKLTTSSAPSTPSSDGPDLESRFEAYLKRREQASTDAQERQKLTDNIAALTADVDKLKKRGKSLFSLFTY